MLRSDGSETRWLAFAPEGYREAILSGDGNWIFAATQWGRLLRIDTGTGKAEELLPRTPWVGQVAGSLWRGSRNRILGGGFTTETWEATEYPAPTEVAGVRVEFNGQALPLLKVSPSEIAYQVPWDFPGFNPDSRLAPEIAIRIVTPNTSNLKVATILLPFGLARGAVFEEPGAIHEDGEPVTLLKPGRPGDVIRAFTSGYELPRGRTGFPATPEEAAQPGLQCTVDYDPSAILSAGLAVGKVGMHEVVARLPARFSGAALLPGWVTLQCFDGSRLGQMAIPIKP